MTAEWFNAVSPIAISIATIIVAALAYFVKDWLGETKANIAELPKIRTELEVARVKHENSQRQIDHAHRRLDEQGNHIQRLDTRVTVIESRDDDTELQEPRK